MQDKILYEYAVIELFLKLKGRIHQCGNYDLFEEKMLYSSRHILMKKFDAFESELNKEQVQLNLRSFELIANGKKKEDPLQKWIPPHDLDG